MSERNGMDEQKGEWRYGGCHACFGAPCPVRAKIVKGQVVKVEAQKIPLLNGLCAKGHALIDQLYRADRLKSPMRRVGKKGEGKFKRISWDEALTEIASVLKRYRDEGHPEYVTMVYGCGGWGNRPLFDYFRRVYGTPNFSHHHGDTCNASCNAAVKMTGGGGRLDMGVPDYCNSRYILEVSHNPLGGANAPIHESVRTFNEAMRNGTKIVVVDPRLSETAAIPGAEWIPIKPGTDGAFYMGLINVLISESYYDANFLVKYTNAALLIHPDRYPLQDENGNFLVWDIYAKAVRPLDEASNPALLGGYDVTLKGKTVMCKTAFQLLAERAAQYPPKRVEEITTIPARKLTQIAKEMGAAKPAVATNWNAPRSCFYTNSLQTWRLRYILGMLLGNYDVPGGMVCERLARLHLAAPPTKPTKPITAPSIENDTDAFRFPYSDAIPKFTRRAILEGTPYPIKAMILYAHAPLNSHTNPHEYRRALEKEDFFLVVIDIWPNDHIDYADIVLPDACSLARLQIGSNVWANRMKVVGGLLPIIEPMYDARDVSDIYIELAKKLGFGEYFNFTKEEWFDAQLHPLGIDVNYLKKQGMYYELTPPEYYRFPYLVKPETLTRRLEIFATSPLILDLYKKTGDPHADPLPDHIPLSVGELTTENEFYLLSARHPIHQKSTSQDNAYLMEDYLNGFDFTAIWINTEKASKLGIKNEDVVKISSDATGAEGLVKVRVTEGIHPSAAFAFTGFGHRAKMMTLKRGKEGINVNEFVPDHMELVCGAAATQEAIVKIERVV